MHILVHDYAGHPFQVQLSRELAKRGYRVTHAWFAEDSGPKGKMSNLEEDPLSLEFLPLGAGLKYSKKNFLQRRVGDIKYGKICAKWIIDNRPEIVISGNTPTEAQENIIAACKSIGSKFIFWCQDFYSIAASKILRKRLPALGGMIGTYYRFIERHQMLEAHAIIHITDAFIKQTDRWGIDRRKVSVVPNWGALEEIPMMPRDTAWSQRYNFKRAVRVIYSGTLGLKHNPELLRSIAVQHSDRADVIVVGTGTGADSLAMDPARPSNLTVLPVQDIDDFPQVLASANVLVAVIEEEAGEYSVPSKILSYLCAGRPIVLAAPSENLASKIVNESGAGIVVHPSRAQEFVDAIGHFLDNEETAASSGRAGREYAEKTFNIRQIADKFEKIFRSIDKDT